MPLRQPVRVQFSSSVDVKRVARRALASGRAYISPATSSCIARKPPTAITTAARDQPEERADLAVTRRRGSRLIRKSTTRITESDAEEPNVRALETKEQLTRAVGRRASRAGRDERRRRNQQVDVETSNPSRCCPAVSTLGRTWGTGHS